MKKPLVSIIIPTYNSEKTLELCLKSIKRQTYRDIEVIVVDNYSFDKTIDIARRFQVHIVRCRCGRAKAKNIGLRTALGEYVLFIDSDMELTPKVVEECVSLAISNPRIAGIIIPEKSVGKSYFARVRDLERSTYVGSPIESPRFFRRDLAIKAGGFDEDVVFYEEATLPLKLESMGFIVRARIRSYILHHEEHISLSRWLVKKYYYSKSARKYINRYKHSTSVKIQRNIVYRFILFFKNPIFWIHPHIALGVIALKTLEAMVSVLGYVNSN